MRDACFTLDPRSILMEVTGYLMLKKPQPMIAAPMPHNTQKYYEFHEQNGHTTTKCWELNKALHEVVDRGEIDHFLKTN